MNSKYLILLLIIVLIIGCKKEEIKKEEINIAPLKPNLLFPENHAVNSELDVRFVWNSSFDENYDDISYRLAIGLDIDNLEFTDYSLPSKTDTVLEIAGLSANTTYYWKVRAIDYKGAISESEVWEFSTIKVAINEIVLTSQEQINNFGKEEYFGVGNGLIISENQAGDIIDLRPLSSVNFVTGSLRIRNNEKLTSLAGLENLNKVVGNLEIENNNSLESLNSLSNLASVLWDIEIHGNESLIQLNALPSLDSVGGEIRFIWNDNLKTIDGFNNVRIIEDGLFFQSNSSLESIFGFESIVRLGGLGVSGCPKLQVFECVKEIEVIDGLFSLSNNSLLFNLSSLNKLRNIYGNLIVSNCHSISSLSFLSNLNFIDGDVEIASNYNLQDFCGLKKLLLNDQFTGNVNIHNNFTNPEPESIVTDCE